MYLGLLLAESLLLSGHYLQGCCSSPPDLHASLNSRWCFTHFLPNIHHILNQIVRKSMRVQRKRRKTMLCCSNRSGNQHPYGWTPGEISRIVATVHRAKKIKIFEPMWLLADYIFSWWWRWHWDNNTSCQCSEPCVSDPRSSITRDRKSSNPTNFWNVSISTGLSRVQMSKVSRNLIVASNRDDADRLATQTSARRYHESYPEQ